MKTARKKPTAVRKPSTPPARACCHCGAPEVVTLLGGVPYSNLTPFSGTCVECLNRAMRLLSQ